MRAHRYPVALPGFFNLYGAMMSEACPAAIESARDVCVVPCIPGYACTGNNFCRLGYVSVPPMFRCATCDAYARAAFDPRLGRHMRVPVPRAHTNCAYTARMRHMRLRMARADVNMRIPMRALIWIPSMPRPCVSACARPIRNMHILMSAPVRHSA